MCIRDRDSSLEFAGQTGYYHTASIAASSAEDPHAVWSMSLGCLLYTSGPVKKRTLWAYRALRWFPGILIFPVLFSGLVYLCLLYTSRCV